jgi:hypothetical protein
MKILRIICISIYFISQISTFFNNNSHPDDRCCRYQYNQRALEGCCSVRTNDICCKPLRVYESKQYIKCKQNKWHNCTPKTYRIGEQLFHQVKDQILDGVDYENGTYKKEIYQQGKDIYVIKSKSPYYYPATPLEKYKGKRLTLMDGEDGDAGRSTFTKGSQGGEGGQGGEAAKDSQGQYLGNGGDGGDGGSAYKGGGGGDGGDGGAGIFGGDGGHGGHSFFEGKAGDGGEGGRGMVQDGEGGDGGDGYHGARAGDGAFGGDGGDAYFGGVAGDGGPGGNGGDAFFAGTPGKKGPGGRRDGKFYPFGKDFGTFE